MKKWGFLVFPILALAVGGLAGYLSRTGLETVYPQLEKSPLTPPGAVFPIVWVVLYILMGVGLALVVYRGGPGVKQAALFCLVILWLAILAMTAAFAVISRPAAWLQIPYLLWVAFAGYLNGAVWLLNR